MFQIIINFVDVLVKLIKHRKTQVNNSMEYSTTVDYMDPLVKQFGPDLFGDEYEAPIIDIQYTKFKQCLIRIEN